MTRNNKANERIRTRKGGFYICPMSQSEWEEHQMMLDNDEEFADERKREKELEALEDGNGE